MSGDSHPYPHLRLVGRIKGRAKLFGGGKASEQTRKNRADRHGHSAALGAAADTAQSDWHRQQAERRRQDLPTLPVGFPLLLKIDPSLDLDQLRSQLGIEIVSEHEDGFVVVASADSDLTFLMNKVREFAESVQGSAAVASVHGLFPESTRERLQRICPWLLEQMPRIQDGQDYIVDVGIECTGTREIPSQPDAPKRRAVEGEVQWAKREAKYQIKLAAWAQARTDVYAAWDELKDQRTNAVSRIVTHYRGRVLGLYDAQTASSLSDSFTMRVRLPGLGLKDFVQNYPFVFEVVEPDDIALPQHEAELAEEERAMLELDAPDEHAPAVGVIDSGIQEKHLWLASAIDAASSVSFLHRDTGVADLVKPSGHGTRVAGAVLFGEAVPREGRYKFPCWIQNGRVLSDDCNMPESLLPALATRFAVLRFRGGSRKTRLFNQSINASAPARLVHMSAWAAEIDALSHEYDVLVVQSVGNVMRNRIQQHLDDNRGYPDYLDEPSSRVANPGQSLQALTVGSVAHDTFAGGGWRSFAAQVGEPSSFSRAGPGIWGVIKPEVVEFGGDFVYSHGPSTNVGMPMVASVCYPELIRSTLYSGSAMDRDEVGTSFAAPKVTHIAAHLAAILPNEPSLLYRALIVQSARWPSWALDQVERYRREKQKNQKLRTRARNAVRRAKKKGQTLALAPIDERVERALKAEASALMRRIGFGIPNLERATRNSEYRTTLITTGLQRLEAGACDILNVPIPAVVRAAGNDYDVLVEVTLSYAASPRRTRRTPKRYLSVWLDWITNRRGESMSGFAARAIKEPDGSDVALDGGADEPDENTGSTAGSSKDAISWTLGAQDGFGSIHGFARGNGTVQKDWTILKLHELPETFCIAVRAHKGWSQDPSAEARYALVVSFEVLGQEVAIYEEVRIALDELPVEVSEE